MVLIPKPVLGDSGVPGQKVVIRCPELGSGVRPGCPDERGGGDSRPRGLECRAQPVTPVWYPMTPVWGHLVHPSGDTWWWRRGVLALRGQNAALGVPEPLCPCSCFPG